MGVNMEDEELVKMVNPTLKRREVILFFLIVVINGLKCIVSDIGLDTCARGCSSHITLVGLLYPGGDKLEKVCTGYEV